MELLIWLIIIPLFTIFSIGIFNYINKKYVLPVVFTSAILQSGIAIYYILNRNNLLPQLYNVGNWQNDIAINLSVDNFTLVVFVLIAVMPLLSLLYSITEIQRKPAKFYLLINVLLLGASGMVMTADLFNFYVFFEIASISSYALVAFKDEDISLEAAFEYLIIGSIGAVFLLLGIVLTYQATGTLNMAIIPERMAEIPVVTRQVLMSLFIIGLGVKFALVPLHAWMPDAYQGSPISYIVLSSGLVVNVYFFVLVRILFIFFGVQFFQETIFTNLIVGWGVASMLFGHGAALQQDNLKRLFAYSTIAQLGYVIIAFGIGTEAGIVAGSFHLINHAFLKGAIFFTAGNLYKATNSYQIRDMKGLAEKMPVMSIIFVLMLIAMVGIPPSNIFVSKWLILTAAVEAGYLVPAFMILVGSFISLGYYLRPVITIYTGYSGFPGKLPLLKFNEYIPTLFLAGVCLMIGLFPGYILNIIDAAPDFLLEQSNFILHILGG
ncbi:proton-conducting membrane transporter [Halanaerobiaceae bacterium Z-7014]|uniref:Proton-conducting membrane transporter n=1 Tax=Halonatronomonas betaini TaxID=2778430 RepID=A0A931ARD6_9FIRM|nr:proton-conducting transporter membrane subunit [Halonatronomonas betaini]MBF8437102.1 proton-conducting membrane transporter [Halonatronomonas betaini]